MHIFLSFNLILTLQSLSNLKDWKKLSLLQIKSFAVVELRPSCLVLNPISAVRRRYFSLPDWTLLDEKTWLSYMFLFYVTVACILTQCTFWSWLNRPKGVFPACLVWAHVRGVLLIPCPIAWLYCRDITVLIGEYRATVTLEIR